MSRNSFFTRIKNKYNLFLSKENNRVVCIFADGKNIVGNKNVNLLDEKEGSFSYALKKVAKEKSKEYNNCLVFCATDEIEFIFLDSKSFLDNFKNNRVQEICSIFSQKLFYDFLEIYKKPIYFKCCVFSLYRKNIWSYIIDRKHRFTSNLCIYYLKRKAKNYNRENKTYLEMNEYGNKFVKGYKDRTIFQKEGLVFYKGKEFTFEEILKNHNLEDLYNSKYGEYFEDDIL